MTAWRSNRAAVEALLTRATDAGLRAGAAIPLNVAKRRLRNGYTTGRYAQGARGMLGLIAMTEPTSEFGKRVIRIGVQHLDPPYPLFWELGHVNLFVGEASGGAAATSLASRREGRYVRVEVFRPALMDNAAAIEAAFQRAFVRVWGGGPAGPASPDGGSLDVAAD